MSIFVTGDTHGHIDINKLNVKNFPEQKDMTKDDYLIICGDFGLVWNNSEQEKHLRKILNNRNFTTLVVDGNHENFDMLNNLKEKEWNGGKVGIIEDNILHLKRGNIYDLQGFKVFAMGGATSIDKQSRQEGLTWWKEEEPSFEEINFALDNLKKHNNKVDLIVTHTTSNRKMKELGFIKENNNLNQLFDIIEDTVDYRKWYFGHFHDDRTMNDSRHTMVYDKVLMYSL